MSEAKLSARAREAMMTVALEEVAKIRTKPEEPSGKNHCGDDSCGPGPYEPDACDCCCSRCGPWNDYLEEVTRFNRIVFVIDYGSGRIVREPIDEHAVVRSCDMTGKAERMYLEDGLGNRLPATLTHGSLITIAGEDYELDNIARAWMGLPLSEAEERAEAYERGDISLAESLEPPATGTPGVIVVGSHCAVPRALTHVQDGECRCECHACEMFGQHHGPGEGDCQIPACGAV